MRKCGNVDGRLAVRTCRALIRERFVCLKLLATVTAEEVPHVMKVDETKRIKVALRPIVKRPTEKLSC